LRVDHCQKYLQAVTRECRIGRLRFGKVTIWESYNFGKDTLLGRLRLGKVTIWESYSFEKVSIWEGCAFVKVTLSGRLQFGKEKLQFSEGGRSTHFLVRDKTSFGEAMSPVGQYLK